MLALCLLASTLILGLRPATADAAAADVNSMNFYGSELIWQPGAPQPVHDTSTNKVSSFGPIKDVVCGTVVTFFQRIEMSGGTDNVLALDYEFGYDSSANEGLGLRDVVGLYIHPDSTDLDGDATVSLLSEDVVPNPDTPGTVREYTPVIEVTGLDAGDVIWVQIDIEVGCDPGTGSNGTAQAVYAGATETTSGERLGGGSQTIPGLSPQAPPSWGFSKQAFDADGNPITEADPFQEVTFVFTVSNTGLVGLNAPTLTDDLCSPVTLTGGDLDSNNIINAAGPLWPGRTFDAETSDPAEVWTYECTMTMGDSTHTNVGTLSDMPNKGVGPTESTVTLPISPPAPGVTVTKTVDQAYIETGTAVTWTINAENTGNVALTAVTPSDPDCGTLTFVAASDSDGDGWLDSNETWSWTCTSASLTATTTNSASVAAEDAGGSPVSDTGSATTTLIGLTLDKIPPAGAISAPGDVTYTFDVENTGDATLDPISVNDPKTGAVSCPVTSLAPGASTTCTATYTVTQDDIDAGQILNSATAAGTAPDGTTTTDAADSETTATTQSPAWTVVKSTTSTPTTVGDTLSYSFVVDNTGNVSISGVTVADAKCASAPTLTGGDTDVDNELDPDETWTYTCTSVGITQDDVDAGQVDNSVSVSGTPAGGSLDPAEGDESTSIPQSPSWTVVKTTDSEPTVAGDTLLYSFAVDNTGNVSISNVVVSDDKCASAPVLSGGDTDVDNELDVDETWTYTCTSVGVTQDEVEAGKVDNSVSVSGTPAGGTLDPAEDDVSTTIERSSGMTVVKSTTSSPTAAGDTLTYSFEVDNTGNVSISAVTVTDDKCASAPSLTGGDTDLDGVLDASETWTYTCTSVPVTQDEVDAGQVENTVDVDGSGADGASPSATDMETTSIPQSPSWTVVKSTASEPAAAGDTLDYTFVVDNTGNVSISAVSVADDKCAAAPTLTGGDTDIDGVLDVDETWTYTCTSLAVTQDEVDAGQVDNSVSVAGTPAGGTLDPVEDDVSTTIPRSPSWTIVKSTDSTPTSAGDTLDYTFEVENTGNVSITGVSVTDAKCAATPSLIGGDTDVDGVLDVDETWTYTCTSIAVTQDEVDAGQVDNSVSITGSAAGTVIFAADDETTSIDPAPAWTLVKSTSSTPDAAGDTLNYTFLVENTGNVTIGDVAIADAKCAEAPAYVSGDTDTDTALDVGETWTFSCTSIAVTQDEVDAGEVANAATATGTPVAGILDDADDDIVTSIPQAPAFSLVKSTGSTPTEAGETLDYTFAVDNTGNVSIADVVVADDKCASAPTLDSGDTDLDGELDVDETWTFSCTSIAVTQDEVDAGQVNNSATVTGTPAGGTLAPADDSLVTPIAADPAWQVIKTATTEPAAAGDTIDYNFVVISTGNVTISAISLDDPKCATTPSLDSESVAADEVLQPGETQVWSCTSIAVTQAEVDAGEVLNDVTVTGTAAAGVLAPAVDDHTVAVTGDPSWTVFKSTSSAPTVAGETLDYSFTVVNTGNVSISSIAITDPKCATAPALDSESIADDTVAEPGETQVWSCTSIPVTQAEVDAGTVDNVALVSGTPAGGSLDDTSPQAETPIAASPSWALTKSSSSTPMEAGDTLVYEFVVENTGNVSITAVSIADPKCADPAALQSGDAGDDSVLAPGEIWTFSCTSIPVTQAEVDAGQVDNTATATGTPAGGTLVDATASTSVTIDAAPEWSLLKSTASAPTAEGETLDYTFTLINTGNVTIDDIAIADAKCATTPAIDSESVAADGILAVGETQVWSCTSVPVTQAEIDAGFIDNEATASGNPAGGLLPDAIDDHQAPVAQAPQFVVEKTTASTPSTAGETLEYSFSVINTGNISISDVTIADAKCATTPVLDLETVAADGVLVPGETQVWSCTSVPVTQDEVDAGEIENTVTVTGTPAGGTLVPVDDTHVIDVAPAPAWNVVKTSASVPVEADDTLLYTFAVSNDGNVSISSIVVTDDKCAESPSLSGGDLDADSELDPDETWTYTCTSIGVTQDEVDAGQVDNSVSVAGTPAGGSLDPATDSFSTPIEPAAEWTVFKSATSTVSAANETVDYAFTVVNSGNVTIRSVAVTDAKCATAPTLDSESITDNGELEPGETQLWSCTSVPVTQAEIDAGIILNDVTVSGVPAGGDLEAAFDDHALPVDAGPAWTIVKGSASTPTLAGETLEYTFSIVNTGNVPISDVVVTAATGATTPTIVSETIDADSVLRVGENKVCSCTSVPVTQAEVDAGQVDNTVSAAGTPAGGVLPGISDSLTRLIEPAPSWAVSKRVDSLPQEAGDTIDYSFTLGNTGNVTIDNVVLTDAKCATVPTIDSGDTDLDNELDVGETWNYTCTSIPVTQAEVDAGQVDNDVSVSGDPAGGTLAPATDEATAPIEPAPAWTVVKSTTDVVTAADETLEYTFSVVNTGNVTITVVSVDDPKCATTPALVSESIAGDTILQVGETQAWSCTSIPVTQDEIDLGQVLNDVIVVGTPAGGTLDNATDDLVTFVAQTPSWALVKSAANQPFVAGDTIDYTFALINDGNVTISGVVVADPKCAASPTLDSESVASDSLLAVGETQIWSCTSVPVTQDEVDAGQVDNTATATGIPAGGVLDPATADHTTPVPALPAFALVKSTDSVAVEAGDTLDYGFELTNTGNVTINGPVVADAKCASAPSIDSESITEDGVLEVGETQVWSCTSVPVTQAEVDAGQVDNTATASGTPANGTLDDAEASLTTPISADPSFSLVKSTDSYVGAADDVIEYLFTVVNTGNVTIASPIVADDKCATAPSIDSETIAADGVLAAGEVQVWSCTSIGVTQAEVDAGQVDNTATLSGTPAGGTLDPTTDDHTLEVLAQPSLAVAKATSSTPFQAGDTLEYTFTVVNTGNVTVSAPSVVDPKCAAFPEITSESLTTDGVLQVGETQIWSCTSIPVTQAEVDAGTVDNGVTVTGTPAGGELPPSTDTVTTPVVAAPSWSLVKSTGSNPTQEGDTLTYVFTVENTGNVTINGVAVVDAKCDGAPEIDSESVSADGVLQVDETQVWSCTSIPVTQTEVDAGQVDNTATATGTPVRGTLDSLEDSHRQPITAAPSFAAVKATTTVPGGADETLEYTFTVVNTGNVTISDVTIADAKCATIPSLDVESLDADALLQVGETQVWSCTSIPLTQDDVDAGFITNVATIGGTPSGGELDPVVVDHTAPITADPSFEVVKAGGEQPEAAGDTIDYTFTLVNTGNVTIDDIAVADGKCATTPTLTFESVTTDSVLQVGETQIWSCTSIPVTQDEVDAGQVDNSVTVDGTPAGGELDPATDTETVAVDAAPAWTLAKTTDSIVGAADDTLEYRFVLTNTGNVTISDAVVSDPKCAAGPTVDSESISTDGTLQVDEVWNLSCTSIPVTQAEIDAGEVNNTATAAGTPARGTLADVFDSVSTDIVAAPAFEIAKTTSSQPGAAGETLDYSFTIINTGNVTLIAVDVDDPKCATEPVLDTESIIDDGQVQVGELQVWSCTSIPVTQAEADAGRVDNLVTVNATPVAGVVDPETAEHTVPLDAAPSLEVVKSTADTAFVAGDTLVYRFTVVNTGNVTILDTTVDDSKCASAATIDSESIAEDGELEVGEVQVWSCTSVGATQAEIDAGSVDNSVTVSGTPVGGVLDDGVDSVSTPVLAAPSWSLTKSTDSTPLRAGDTLDYVFELENTGNVTITGIAFDDPKCAADPVLEAESIVADGELEPGEVQTWTCTSIEVTQDEVDAGQVDNLASVEGVPARGELPPTSASTVTVIVADGSLELVKAIAEIVDTNATGMVDAGDFATYTFSVTNTGNVVLSNVAIEDPSATMSGGPIARLAPGETDSTTFTAERFLTQADLDAGFIDNTAEAVGQMPNGALASDTSDSANPSDTGSVDEFGDPVVDGDGMPVEDGDTANDPTRWILTPQPSINLQKTSTYEDTNENGVVDEGDSIRYAFVVSNDGNVTLTDITIDDPSVTVEGGPIASMAPGTSNSSTFTAVREITTADIDAGGVTNTATVTGTAPDGTPTTDVSDDPTEDTNVDPDDDGNPDDPTFTTLTPNPSLDVVKSAVSFPVSEAGHLIVFDIVVTNNGTVTLTDVEVNDPLIDPDAPVCDPTTDAALASIAPGDSVTCRVTYVLTQDDVDAGGVTNTATAEGSDPSGETVTDVSDSGSRTPPGNDGNGSDDPTFVQIPARPELELVKTAVSSDPDPITAPGATITYSFTITNVGNVTVTDVVLTDDRATIDCPEGSLDALAPFDEVTCSGTAIVGQVDVDLGGFVNTAEVSGSDPTGATVRDLSDSGGDTPPGNDGAGQDDPTWTTITTFPSLELDKTVASVSGNGDGSWNVSWIFTLVNDGNVTVANVEIADALVSQLPPDGLQSVEDITISAGACEANDEFDGAADPVIATADSMAPGASCVVRLDTVIVPGVGVTTVANSATAGGTDPQGRPVDDVSDSGDETVDAPGPDGTTDGDPTNDVTIIDLTEAPLIGIAKSLSAGPELLADGSWAMTFTLAVENLGDVPLLGVGIDEDLDAAFQGEPFTIEAIDVDGPCTVADDFDGVDVVDLLSGEDTLAVGASCVIDLMLTVRPAGRMIGENQVTASGTSPGGTTVTDLSTIGTSADPDGDGSPDEEGPNPFVLAPPAAPDQDLDNEIGEPVTVDPLENDGSGVPLDPTSVVLVDPDTGERVTTLVVEGEGEWVVDSTSGLVTFTPEPGFEGDPTPVDYEVTVEGTDVVLGSSVEITYVDPVPPTPTQPTVVIPPAPAPTFLPDADPEPRETEQPEGPLAFTGANSGTLAVAGLMLVLLGSAFVMIARRRDED